MKKSMRGALLRFTALAAAALVTVSFSVTGYAAEEISINASGNINRDLSVDPTGMTEGFSAVLYDNTNGLPTSEANAIAETSEGFIWIGSYAGLIRYDGETFLRMDSTGGLTSIKCLYVDSKDRLWIGTNDNGVAVMEKGNIRMWGKLDGMSSAHTRALAEDKNGVMYIATTSGIMMIDSDFNLSQVEGEELASADMRNLRMGIDGTIYGTTDLGDLIVIRDGKLVSYIDKDDTALGGFGTILPDPEEPNRIYAETADFGLYHIDLSDGFKIKRRISLDPLRYLMSMEYIEGKIWITAGNGVGVLEDGSFRLIENLPMNNSVGHVMTDYLGNLWFTSTRQGVMKVVPNRFSDIFTRFDIPEAVVNSTCMYDDMLFAATDKGLIVIGKDGQISELPLTKAVTASGNDLEATDLIEFLTDVRIRSVIRDSKDRLWLSTWRKEGLLRYEHGELTAFTVDDGLLSPNIRAVSEADDGSIFVALTGGANVIKGDAVVASYGKEDGISNIETLCVETGKNGDIILGSNGGGIYIIGESGFREINVEDGLPSDIVMRIKQDPINNLIWIVTSNAIAYMTQDYQLTTVKKFPYPNNFDLYENSSGDMWVLSSNGIYVLPAQELIANGDINPVFYGTANGLSCIATANSYSDLTENGDLYIAGSTGVCKVNIEESNENVNEQKVAVPFVEADGQVIYPDEEGKFTIPLSTRKLTIPSYVFNYSLTNPQVSYQLKGFDQNSNTVNRSELQPVDYTNLRGGTYHFVIQLKDSMGRGDKEVSVEIVKEKAFYEQTWFYIASGLVLIGLITLLVHFYIQRRMRALEKKHLEIREQFEQTAEALANAIDAKDKYTNGHSRRVAEYSMKIAKEAGLSEEECEKVYFAALLHDVGKIGVPIEILSKNGGLTDEEFAKIKQHPVMGGQILSSIKKSPWLSIGARYHHERVNGRGYPDGLKGEDIPEIARIIAVADAYDAMTSNRSYRNAIPQHIVRNELIKGSGTQFDPKFARVMIHMIDRDKNYGMRESKSVEKPSGTTELRCDSLYNGCTEGFRVAQKTTRILMCNEPDNGIAEKDSLPTLIIFDSLDANVHPGEENNRNILYCEYARIRLDGEILAENVRKTDVQIVARDNRSEANRLDETENGQRYIIESVRYRDHLLVKIAGEKSIVTVTLAMPDASRYSYISISGEHCYVHNIRVDKDENEIGPNFIKRIAEEIDFTKGCPQGDVPNVQVDNLCTMSTQGMKLSDGNATLTFHTMSLPTARLVWHCPYIRLYSSSDGTEKVGDYSEWLLLKLNGEEWQSGENVDNEVNVSQKPEFDGWNSWMDKNKQGYDCTVKIQRNGNKITMKTENLGIAIESEMTIHGRVEDIFVSITGDQVALSDIHLLHE